MKSLVTEREARLTYLKRKLVKIINQDPVLVLYTYDKSLPAQAIPGRIKRLLREIQELEHRYPVTLVVTFVVLFCNFVCHLSILLLFSILLLLLPLGGLLRGDFIL